MSLKKSEVKERILIVKKLSIKKNDQLQVTIIDLTYEGLGVAKVDNYALFIENALPQEQVLVQILKVGKNFGYAKIIEHISQSKWRVKINNINLLCSGIADLAHLNYQEQLKFKREQIIKVLGKAGLPEVEVAKTLGMENPLAYRNKAQIPVREINGKLTTGFFRKHSHNLIQTSDFYIQDEKINEIIEKVQNLCRKAGIVPYNEEKNNGSLRQIVIRRGFHTKETMVIFVTRDFNTKKYQKLAKKISAKFSETVSIIQNINTQKSNVILGKKNLVLFGKAFIEDTMLSNSYRISPHSFYQVNTEMAEQLYRKAIEFAKLSTTDIVIDAYCGIGTIGQSLAKSVKHVYGAEIVSEAIANARYNAQINGLDNVTYELAAAEEALTKWINAGISPNVLIVDPSRKGLTKNFIRAASKCSLERIVYISCNPATFACDLKIFAEFGWKLIKVAPIDLFPQTHHIECVGLLENT